MMMVSLSLLLVVSGCQRKPEDLEVWRPSRAKNGLDKLKEWIADDSEPMPVRVRASEILVEEDYAYALATSLEKASEGDRATIVAQLTPTILQWYNTQDATVEAYETNKSKQVIAKEGLYHLYKHAPPEQKAQIEAALVDWLSKDLFVRNQMGTITVNQIAEALGPKGAEPLLKALADPNNQQHTIAADLRKIKDKAIDAKRVEVLTKMAESQLPKLDKDLERAILEEEDASIAPLLVTIVDNDKVEPAVRDSAHLRIGKVQGKVQAMSTYITWVRKGPEGLRWISIQSIAEIQGKLGLTPILAALPEKGTYGEGDPEGFSRDAGRLCQTEVKEMKDTEPVFVKALSTGTTPAKAVALRCLQEVGTQAAAKAPVEKLVEDETPLPAWGETKTLGALAKETLGKLK
ncbi:MAG: hypothetical protein CMH57_07300 [Myxococcales bacterium]|nr:hypothetical protein [Myxococcales bacterium]